MVCWYTQAAGQTGVQLNRTYKLSLVSKYLSFDCVEDEHHFLVDCPAYMYMM